MSAATVPTPAARGLRTLSKRSRQLHPRAQVQSLRKSAVIALGKAERIEAHLGGEFEDPGDRDRIAAYRKKADDCLAACLYLNRAHDLGYPVP